VKLKFLFLPIVALAGVGASFALADDGHRNGPGHGPCQRAHLRGVIASPATFTVTVAKSAPDGTLTAGQVVTVSLGTSGRPVWVDVGGCANGSSLIANEAELHAAPPERGRPDGQVPQAGSTPGSIGTTTVSNFVAPTIHDGGDGDHRDRRPGDRGKGDAQPPVTTTTAGATTTVPTTTVAATTSVTTTTETTTVRK